MQGECFYYNKKYVIIYHIVHIMVWKGAIVYGLLRRPRFSAEKHDAVGRRVLSCAHRICSMHSVIRLLDIRLKKGAAAMNETRYDLAARPDDWDEQAYDEAKQAWQAWCKKKSEKTEGEELSEEEKLMQAENRRLIAARHDEAKQRRWEAMMRGEEICEEEAEEIQKRREEERMEHERIADEAQRRMEMVIWFTVILIGAMGFLSAIFK